jgi:uncharacterized membrane protein YdjX (TVP38/TMEM64 family)
MTTWESWKYKNLTILFTSLIFAFLLTQLEIFHQLLLSLGTWGYVGAFFAGMLFVLSFTAATGAVILFILAEKLTPWEIGLIAGLGAMVGDLTIFRFVKDDLINELEPLYKRFGGNHVNHVLHTRYFHWTLPLIGALIIASPLPDEIGVSLMGISKMKTYKFIFVSFLLNAIGIFLVISVSLLLKH